MAVKGHDISQIDLTKSSINLNAMKSEICSYETTKMNAKNSLFVGNKMTNWYKKTLANGTYKQYKGIPVYEKNGMITYGENEFDFSDGQYYATEETDFAEDDTVRYSNGNLTVLGMNVVVNPGDYLISYRKINANLIEVSLLPTTPTSIRDINTYVFKKDVGTIDTYSGMALNFFDNVGIYASVSNNMMDIYMADITIPNMDVSSYFSTKVNDVQLSLKDGYNTESYDGEYKNDCFITSTKAYTEVGFTENIKSGSTLYVKPFIGFFSKYFSTDSKRNYCMFNEGFRNNIFVSVSGERIYWAGGIKVNVGSFDLLYNYSGVLEGISKNNSLIIRDIDEVDEIGEDYIIYRYRNNHYKVYLSDFGCKYFIVKNYLCINTTKYANTINLDTGKVFCRSDDYNNRIFAVCGTGIAYVAKQTSTSSIWNTDSGVSFDFEYASAHNESYYADNLDGISTIEAPVSLRGNLPTKSTYSNFYSNGIQLFDINSDGKTRNINIYIPNTLGGVPMYYKTLGNEPIAYSLAFGTTQYPIDTNPLYNITVLDEIIDTYMNQAIVKTMNYDALTVLNNSLNMVFGYYLLTMIEFDDVFILQGVWYASNEHYIIKLSMENGAISSSSIAASKPDLTFIGNTTNEAYFFSRFDKSVYSFKSDYNLTKTLEASAVNEIYETYNNPALSIIAISTDIGLIVFYQDQICLIDESTYKEVYFDDNCIVNGNFKYTIYERDGYEKVPVIMETELLGLGSETKSVNDCVYIRLYADEIKEGKIVLKSKTLTDVGKESESKEIKIAVNDWDKITKTMFIRYQPKNMASTGFSVRIESDFPIATLSIGHKAESIQNTSYNL